MRRPRIGALALLGLLHVLGCGPVQYIGQVSGRAAAAVADARAAQAEKLAPYEYTMAVSYEHEARVVAAYGRFEAALHYGQRAEELATKAATLARARAHRAAAPKVTHAE